MDTTAAHLIQQHQLAPHPEGGHYRRIYESETRRDGRPVLTGIRFLLARGEASRWHRVDGDECWHWQHGDALELLTFDPATQQLLRQRLGPDGPDTAPMRVVPSGCWQAARALGDYAMVACTVSPGFVWDGFALLAADAPLAAMLREVGAWIE